MFKISIPIITTKIAELYFWSKVNIWNIICAQATALVFDARTDVLEKVFETENVSTWGGLEPPIFGFMPNALTIWAVRPDKVSV